MTLLEFIREISRFYSERLETEDAERIYRLIEILPEVDCDDDMVCMDKVSLPALLWMYGRDSVGQMMIYIAERCDFDMFSRDIGEKAKFMCVFNKIYNGLDNLSDDISSLN